MPDEPTILGPHPPNEAVLGVLSIKRVNERTGCSSSATACATCGSGAVFTSMSFQIVDANCVSVRYSTPLITAHL